LEYLELATVSAFPIACCRVLFNHSNFFKSCDIATSQCLTKSQHNKTGYINGEHSYLYTIADIIDVTA